MTRRLPILLAFVLLAAGGCGGVTPSPGMSAVVLKVSAEPKTGAPRPGDPGMGDYANSAAVRGQMERIDYASLDGIIVWLEHEAPAGKSLVRYPAPTQPLLIDTGAIVAGVQPVAVGDVLTIRNGSAARISPYSVSDGNEFTLPPIAPGGLAQIGLGHGAGLIEILVDPAQPPIAVLYAVPSEWFALARAGETVTFNNLPPGKYTAHTWHPRLPGSTIELTLKPNETTKAAVSVSVNHLGGKQ